MLSTLEEQRKDIKMLITRMEELDNLRKDVGKLTDKIQKVDLKKIENILEVTNTETKKEWSSLFKGEVETLVENLSKEVKGRDKIRPNQTITPKIPLKIVGKKVCESSLKASKTFIKKKTYHLGNVSKCPKEAITEHLSANGIQVISCYPLFKRTENADDVNSLDKGTTNTNGKESTAFRICIEENEAINLCNPDIWPAGIILREWEFKPRSPEAPQKISSHSS